MPNTDLQNWHLIYDHPTGLLKSRSNKDKFVESFDYENNQLIKSTISLKSGEKGVFEVNYSNSQIIAKFDAADSLKYNDPVLPGPPNAVVGLAQNIKVPQIPQSTTYNAFNKIESIEEFPLNESPVKIELDYGYSNERLEARYFVANQLVKSRLYVGECEKDVSSSTTRTVTFVNGPDGPVGFEENKNGVKTFYYLYVDHLGSLDVVTDDHGNIIEEHNFDPWGRRRNPATLEYLEDKEGKSNGFSYLLDRGFTGHEHYDQFGIINMNGRLYDPRLGRMLSADIFVKDRTTALSYDRFAYANNNPLMFTDPTGYIARNTDPTIRSTPVYVDPTRDGVISYYCDGVSVPGWSITPMLGGGGASVAKVENISYMNGGNKTVEYLSPSLFISEHWQDFATYESQPLPNNGIFWNANGDGWYTEGSNETVYAKDEYGNDISRESESADGTAHWMYSDPADVSWGVELNVSSNTQKEISNGARGSSSNGGMINFDPTNSLLGAIGVGNDIKNNLIDFAGKGKMLSSGTTKYLKFSKGLGVFGSVITTTYSAKKTYDQYQKGGLKEVAQHRDFWDAGVGGAGLTATALAAAGVISNPVGWVIGAGVLIYGGVTLVYDACNEP